MAAVRLKELSPDSDVLIIEKANIERSGCLAAGINAINAYLNPGETPETFLRYVKKDSGDLVREDLVLSIAERLNDVTDKMVEWGLPVEREADCYVPRGKRSIRINGEPIKPILAAAARRSGAAVLNKVAAIDYIVQNGRVCGVFAVDVNKPVFYVIKARAVICATGGAAGLYRPNNPGAGRHKTWYPPFNAGAGYAMGLRAGAELTTLEMRFIALRVKDTLAPTGTLAQGVKAEQINAKGERYLERYPDKTTAGRLWATLAEERSGNGPCYLDVSSLTPAQVKGLKHDYLNMCPSMVLWWAEQGEVDKVNPLEIIGSEPYVVGGHCQAGYWVDRDRRTTLPGLYAAGDVAGGAPKKYATGCLVEGEIAAETVLKELPSDDIVVPDDYIDEAYERITAPLRQGGFSRPAGPDQWLQRLQKIMDEYAGGISQGYILSEGRLLRARQELESLQQALAPAVSDMYGLITAHEVKDRVLVARALVEHLLARQETRWLVYQERADFPQRNDERWLTFINSRYSVRNNQFTILEKRVNTP